jgi:hypothetical protein
LIRETSTYLAERDGAENVDRDASDPQWPLDRLIDHMGKKGSRWSTVLGLAVPWALSGPGLLVSSVPTRLASGADGTIWLVRLWAVMEVEEGPT